MNRALLHPRHVCSSMCLLLALSGCAAIRKYSPMESQVIESRRLTRQARSAIHKKRWDDAEASLVKAIERCPQDDNARSCLADVLWNRGADRAAIEQLAKAIALSGQHDPVALTKLGQMELDVGELESALRHADQALESDGKLAAAWSLRGLVLRQHGDASQALTCFFRSLSLDRDNTETRIQIAQIYRARNQPQRALAILGAAGGGAGGSMTPRHDFLRGLVLRELSRPQDAAVALARAREGGLTSPELLFHLADAQLAAGDVSQARLSAEEALAMSESVDQVAFQELLQRIDVVQRETLPNSWK